MASLDHSELNIPFSLASAAVNLSSCMDDQVLHNQQRSWNFLWNNIRSTNFRPVFIHSVWCHTLDTVVLVDLQIMRFLWTDHPLLFSSIRVPGNISQIANSRGQQRAHLRPADPIWAPCWPHEPCYQGYVGVAFMARFAFVHVLEQTAWRSTLTLVSMDLILKMQFSS